MAIFIPSHRLCVSPSVPVNDPQDRQCHDHAEHFDFKLYFYIETFLAESYQFFWEFPVSQRIKRHFVGIKSRLYRKCVGSSQRTYKFELKI